jgi:hypothetical protein
LTCKMTARELSAILSLAMPSIARPGFRSAGPAPAFLSPLTFGRLPGQTDSARPAGQELARGPCRYGMLWRVASP